MSDDSADTMGSRDHLAGDIPSAPSGLDISDWTRSARGWLTERNYDGVREALDQIDMIAGTKGGTG